MLLGTVAKDAEARRFGDEIGARKKRIGAATANRAKDDRRRMVVEIAGDDDVTIGIDRLKRIDALADEERFGRSPNHAAQVPFGIRLRRGRGDDFPRFIAEWNGAIRFEMGDENIDRPDRSTCEDRAGSSDS